MTHLMEEAEMKHLAYLKYAEVSWQNGSYDVGPQLMSINVQGFPERET